MDDRYEIVLDRLVILDDNTWWGIAKEEKDSRVTWIWVITEGGEITELHYYGALTQVISEMFDAVLSKNLSSTRIRKFNDLVRVFSGAMNVIKAVSSKLGEEEFYEHHYGVFIEKFQPRTKLRKLIPSLDPPTDN